MSWFANLSTRIKLLVGFGAIWVLLLAVIVMAHGVIAKIANNEVDIRDFGMERTLNIQEMTSHLHFSRGELLEMSLGIDEPNRRGVEEDIRKRATEIDGLQKRIRSLDRSGLHQRRYGELEDQLAEYRRLRNQVITFINQGKAEDARKVVLGEMNDKYERLRGTLADMRRVEYERLIAAIERDTREATSAIQFFWALGGAAFALGLVLIMVLNRTIAKPLKAMADLAAQIAGGDLTVSLPTSGGRNEVGALAQALQNMVGSLRRSTSEISEAVNLLGAAANEIMTATAQIAAGTAETAAAISQTTSTVEQVRQAAQLSNTKAEDVSSRAQGVAQVSRQGNQALDEASGGMRNINQEMESLATTMVFLSEQGQSIGGIIATVTDLADQSNLLAVNAAIEAARAGEQGKGFAVVAQEIKNLADQSKQATTEVRTILSDIQKATSAAVMATEQVSKAVDAGAKQFAQAGEAIRTLADSTTEAAQAATQIAVSSHEQVVGMDQVGVAMENVNQAGTDTAATMKQVELAAHDLNQLGQNLMQLVKRYTL